MNRLHFVGTPRNGVLLLSFLWALCLGMGGATAQNTHLLRGMVLDSLTREPVPFAAVSFTPITAGKAGSVLQQLTDDGGRFAISVPIADEYKAEASFVGKKMQAQILPYSKIKGMGILRLFMVEDTETLKEVTVTAARPLVRLDADRIAYNVKDDPLSKSETLRDMLRKVPLVTVDGQGEVSVKGSKNFRIYLNGNPSKMISSNPKEVLRSIPASTIKSVEVITEPGVKYDAEGVGAILNIITEQATFEGYQAQISSNISIISPSLGGSAFVTSKFGKLGVTANYNGGSYNFTYHPQFNGSDTYYPSSGQRIVTESTMARNKGHYKYHMGDLTLTYDINQHNLLSLSTSLSATGTPYTNFVNTFVYDRSKALISRDSLLVQNKEQNISLDTRLDYEHTTTTPGEVLTLSYQWVHSPNHSNTNTDYRVLDPNNLANIPPAQRQFSQTHAGFDEHTGQVDYVRPFGERWKVEAGLKTIFRRGTSQSEFKLWDFMRNDWTAGSLFGQDKGISGSPMDYRQNIYGVYGNVTFRPTTKLSLVAGTRAEYGMQNVYFAKEPNANLHHTFLDLVPQLIATWNLTDVDQFKLGYNYRVQRPSITQLNPYREQSSPLVIEYGNADLSNEKMHSLDFTYSHYAQKFTLMASTSYQFSNNKIEEIYFSEQNEQGLEVFHKTYVDNGKMRSIGLNLFAQYVPASWLRLYLQGNLDFVTIDASAIETSKGKAYGAAVHRGLGGNSYLGASFTLPHSWSLGANAGIFIKPPTVNLKSFWGSWHSFYASKGFLTDRLNLSAWVSNPFQPWYNFHIPISSPSFEGSAHSRSFTFTTGISISYSFGTLKSAIRKVSRSIENDDLMSSGKKQGGAGGVGGAGGAGGN